MSKLKIAQISPLSESVPPEKYGGTERVISALTEELVRRGHEVTLFASGDSNTRARLISVYPTSLRKACINDPYGLNDWSLLHIGNAYLRQNKFDIIHDHNSILSLPVAEFSRTPVVITLHGPITPANIRLYKTFKKPRYVSITKSQVRGINGFKVSANIYNGLPMKNFPFSGKKGDYLLNVGRIAREKGTHHAIETALKLRLPLIIAAKLDSAENDYFSSYIKPALKNRLITWIGEVDQKERNRLMSRALCLLHPVMGKEPFGLVMIEALACGCPVIALNKGSVPEIVQDGVTGFVVNDSAGLLPAVKKVGNIDRLVCRSYALANFSCERMTDEYEKLYYRVISAGKNQNQL